MIGQKFKQFQVIFLSLIEFKASIEQLSVIVILILCEHWIEANKNALHNLSGQNANKQI